MNPDTTFDAVGDRAQMGGVDARIYWAALAMLTGAPEFSDKTPHEIHALVLERADYIFNPATPDLA